MPNMTFEIVAMFLFLLQISSQAYFTHKCIMGVYVCLSIIYLFLFNEGSGSWYVTTVLAYITVDTHGSRNFRSNIIRRMEALGVGRNLREGLESEI